MPVSPTILLLHVFLAEAPMGQPLAPPPDGKPLPPALAPSSSPDRPAATKTFSFPNLNFSVEVPLTWTYFNSPGDVLHVENDDRKKEFFIKARHEPNWATLDMEEKYAESHLIQNGFVVTSRETMTLHGLNFLEVDATKDMGNKTMSTCGFFFINQGFIYVMTVIDCNGPATTDVELKSFLDSFRLITPPPPTPNPATTTPDRNLD